MANPNVNFSFAGKVLPLLAAGFLAFSVVSSAGTIIDTGERGVVLRLGKLVEQPLDEGFHLIIPMMDRVIKMSTRDNPSNIETEVSSADMQTIKVKMTLIYALNPAEAGKVYQKYNTKIDSIMIKPTLLEITNSIIANYPIEQFVEKRSEISQKILDAFVAKTKNSGIIVKSLLITEHDFSDEYNKAIEGKKVAEQRSLQAKYDLERVKLEAEAQRQKQQSLSPMVLQEKAIDKWDGKLPQYYSGDGLPFITKQ